MLESRVLQQFLQVCRPSGGAAPHRPEVKSEIGVGHRFGARNARHRLCNQQLPPRRQGFSGRGEQLADGTIIMVMHYPDQGDQVGALRQGIVQHVARLDPETRPERRGRQLRFGEPGHRRQVDQHEVQAVMRGCDSDQKCAKSAADIHHGEVAAEVVGREHVLRDQRLGLGHQGRIGGGVCIAGRRGVGPEARQLGIRPALLQQGERIGDVAVEGLVMADHREDSGIAEQRRARFAESKAAIQAHPEQVERGGSAQEAQGAVCRQAGTGGEVCGGYGRRAHRFEQAAFDGGRQDL